MEARVSSFESTGDKSGVNCQVMVWFSPEEWKELREMRTEIQAAKTKAIQQAVTHFINWG